MRDVLYLERLEQAEALLKPIRIAILRLLAAARSCTELANELELTPQKIYYHVKRLEDAGVVTQVAERRVRGIVEGIYQATARTYWLSPGLVGTLGSRRATDELSLGHLLTLAEQMQGDLVQLAGSPQETPSLGISGEIRLRPEDRPAFLGDLRDAIQDLLTRYGATEGSAYRFIIATYPKKDDT